MDPYWKLEADSRAELVVVGIGGQGMPRPSTTSPRAWRRACRLVQHGGKIVVLSRAQGSIGPALQSLIAADDPKQRAAALRGHEGDDDYLAARRLARALAWADVFVLSGLDADVLDDLSVVALENPGASPPSGRQERLVLVRQPGRAHAGRVRDQRMRANTMMTSP